MSTEPDVMMEWAQEYAALGWPVFPLHVPLAYGPKTGEGRATCSCGSAGCDSQGKHPYAGTNGLKDATTDPDTIRQMWDRRPASNIGLATGIAFDVLDLDGPIAPEVLILATPDDAPTGVRVGPKSITGNGSHWLVQPTGQGNRVGLVADGSGIDWRGIGGYIVAPPSVHYLRGDRYQWSDELGPTGQVRNHMHTIPPCPDWLLHLVETRRPLPGTEAASRRAALGFDNPAPVRRVSVTISGETTRYGRAVLERASGTMAGTGEGHRNNTLNHMAMMVGHYVAGGEIAERDAIDVLTAGGQSMGLDDAAVAATIKSGMKAGKLAPQSAPDRTSSHAQSGGLS